MVLRQVVDKVGGLDKEKRRMRRDKEEKCVALKCTHCRSLNAVLHCEIAERVNVCVCVRVCSVVCKKCEK